MKLLLVDDEAHVREGICARISWKKLRITELRTAKNGYAGLELSRKFKPDIVLTDVRMPCMDGVEMAFAIRRELLDLMFLDEFDHYIKEDRGCHYYGRYMDDFYVIARTKRELQLLLKDIERWMSDLHLELNSKTAIFPLKNGLDFLGFHSYLTESGACVQKLRRSEIQRIQTRVKYWEKAYPAGEVTREAVITSFVAWDAFASYGDTYALRLKYAKKVSVIIGVDVKPRRKINSTRSVRALRRVKQEQNIRRKRGDITPRKDLFQPEPRPDSIPPWM